MTTLEAEAQGFPNALSSLQSAGTIPAGAPFKSRPTGQGTDADPRGRAREGAWHAPFPCGTPRAGFLGVLC